MKRVTKKFLESHNACQQGMRFVTENKLIGKSPKNFINTLMGHDKFNWANWLIVRLMTHEQKVKYAVFAAEQVISIYEKKYPEEGRPRRAIEAAKAYLQDPSDKTRRAAADDAAYAAAAAAAYAAAADADAAAAAATAAYAAAAATAAYAAAAATAAYAAAADAAAAAATAAYAAAYAARKDMLIRIIQYGLTLIE